MSKRWYQSKWFWIFIGMFILDELTVFISILAFFLVIAAISPEIGIRYAQIFIKSYNERHGTNLQIFDVSQHQIRTDENQLKKHLEN